MNRIYNFSAGPSTLPTEVLCEVQEQFLNYNKMGISMIELSHRSKEFTKIAEEIEKTLRDLLKIPENYKIILCHGGARGQFSAIPLNLFKQNEQIDYIISGYWSKLAAYEAKKYCIVNAIDVQTQKKPNFLSLKPLKKWKLTSNSKFVHYCSNETIEGIGIHEDPCFHSEKIVISDCSSTILSKPINIRNFGVIYAGSQKNIGPAGVTLIIIREDLLGRSNKLTPAIFDYLLLSRNNSMYSTPSTFTWYVIGLVLKWIKKQGGLKTMEKLNQKKSKILYNFIDKSQFYFNKVDPNYRSLMNIVFRTVTPNLDNKFINEAKKNGLLFLQGHKISGGMRASIYNSMPLSGVYKLVDFMSNFESRNKK